MWRDYMILLLKLSTLLKALEKMVVEKTTSLEVDIDVTILLNAFTVKTALVLVRVYFLALFPIPLAPQSLVGFYL